MYAVEKLSSYISRGVYTVAGPFHPFGGAVDIIVVQQQDGSFKSSPWYVKFGKFQGVLKTKEKVVNINVNGVDAGFHMYLDSKGEAYFLKELEAGGDVVFSSPPSSVYEMDEESQNGRMKKSRSCDLGADQPNSVTEIDMGSRKIVMETNSNRSQIFGFMYGEKSLDDTGLVEEGGAGIERESSVERAEIAANLLEVNWSTNLSTPKRRMNNDSRLSASNVSAEVPYKVSEVNIPVSGNMDRSNEVSSPKSLSRRSQEQDIEITTLEKNVFNEVISETVIRIREFDVGNAEFEMREKANMQYGIEQSSVERDGPSCSSVSEEETGTSCTHTETLETSGIASDLPGEKNLENVNLPHSKFVELHVHPVVQCEEADGIKINIQVESGSSGILSTEENLIDFNSLNDDDSCEFLNTKTIHESKVIPVTRETNSPLVLIHSVTSDSDGSEVVEVIHEETKLEKLTPKKSLALEQVEDPSTESSSPDLSYSCTCGKCKVAIEEPSTAVVPHVQVVSVNRIVGSIVKADSTSFSYFCACGNCKVAIEEPSTVVVPHVQVVSVDRIVGSIEEAELRPSLEFNGVSENLGLDCPHSKLSSSSIVTSESLEEDQILFGDNDDSLTSGVESKDCISTLNDIEALSDIHESSLSSDKFAQGCSSKAFNPLIEESNTSSSPMSILRSPKGAEEEVEGLIQSLPILRSHIDNLEAPHVLNPLSHSLGSSSEKLKRSLGRRDITSPLKFESDSEHHLHQVDPSVDDLRSLKKLKDMSPNSMIEISLCKHLLYEGMGVDAASQAFDAEKLEFENFVSPASDLVKDDRIVVRIGGQYLPWDVAAPVILEMVSFGPEHIFDLKGVITVDRVEKSLEGDASGTIESPGGSWKLWPFTFSRSKSMNFVREAPNDTKLSDAENASESNNVLPKCKTLPKLKVTKKKVKSIVPTSEQLITLNLNEGQNVVTFTFSTAMLGKQQVDARIYLWKWNTRIVISDVDGTITKSDVLGQFMPLVGKDWSQTGVAPLFSAIKENGYQLLFLSARSISQAYLTRQFLLNLRQDGKALPAGPVVISPDGLFPSLFREVIRRAPHEFKIACLNDIKALFPPDCNPFYAGFGNRDTDEFSYLKVGIPKGKIFIVNPKGEVAVNRRVDTKSYTSIHALVNGMFPPISSAEQVTFYNLRNSIPGIFGERLLLISIFEDICNKIHVQPFRVGGRRKMSRHHVDSLISQQNCLWIDGRQRSSCWDTSNSLAVETYDREKQRIMNIVCRL